MVSRIGAALAALAALALVGGAVAAAGRPAALSGQGPLRPATAPLAVTQDFQDVPVDQPFYLFLHNLYLDGIVGGYSCGGTDPPEPCVPPANLPYYRPNNAVTRLQMTKFVDNARRNIADAVGNSLLISTTSTIAVNAKTTSLGEALRGECLAANTGCWAVEGYSGVSGDFAGHFSGGEGLFAESNDAGYPGAELHATGSAAYAADIHSDNFRGGYVNATTPGYISLYVDKADNGVTDLYVNSGAEVTGNMIVDGSKTGYVVDVMQNADTTPLEPGDVVVIVGNGPPVVGQIPVVLVKKATTAYDSSVAGIVDQVMYVPDAATKAAYAAQEAAIRAAQAARDRANAAAAADGSHAAPVVVPLATITDDQGNLHALPNATDAAPGGYVNVVTLGSYKAVKADASFGAIHTGDLLTTSPHAGYAMKVTDKAQAMGAVIGKALGDLASGTGTVPVLVTLK